MIYEPPDRRGNTSRHWFPTPSSWFWTHAAELLDTQTFATRPYLATLIKSKVIKGIFIQSLPNCCHFLAAACGQTAHILRDIVRMERGWKEHGAALPPARWSPDQLGREATPWRHATRTAQQQADNQAFSLISSTRQYEGVSKWFLWKDRLFLKWPWSQTGPSCMDIYGSLQADTWRSFFHPNTIWYHWKCEIHFERVDNNNLDCLIFGQLVRTPLRPDWSDSHHNILANLLRQ